MEQKDIDRVIEMAWEDRTPFEATKRQFKIGEPDIISVMGRALKRGSFNLWRRRVNSGVSQKHIKKRSVNASGFKCSRQELFPAIK